MLYAITGAGRQWAMIIKFWLTEDMGMITIEDVSQLYIRR